MNTNYSKKRKEIYDFYKQYLFDLNELFYKLNINYNSKKIEEIKTDLEKIYEDKKKN